MRRIALIALAAALFTSTAAVAFADDAETETEPDETSETRDLNEAQMWKAQMLADYMVGDDVDAEATEETTEPIDLEALTPLDEIVELRTGDTVVGWGAIFKLLQYSKATGEPLSALLERYDADEEGWAFGRMFKDLDDDQLKLVEGTAKNFGQLKKEQKAPKENHGKKSHEG